MRISSFAIRVSTKYNKKGQKYQKTRVGLEGNKFSECRLRTGNRHRSYPSIKTRMVRRNARTPGCREGL